MDDQIDREKVLWLAQLHRCEDGFVDAIRALPTIAPAVGVKPLVWDEDRRSLRMDDTMMMGKGYDFDTMELTRQEGYGLGCGYIIWAIRAYTGKWSWNLYGTFDGLYIQDLSDENAAKAAAQADYEARILAALDVTPIDPAQIRADALREAAAAIAALPTGKTEDVCEGHEQAYRVVLALIDQPAPDPVANAARVIRQHGAEATATAMILHIAETLQAKGKAVLTTDHGDFGQQVLEYARAIAEGQP